MEVPILQNPTGEVDDQGSDQRVEDENKMNDQQVEADLGGEHMEAEKNEVGGEQVGTEQAEDVKIEAEKNETGGEDMEAEDIGMGGGEVENGKVTAVGEQVEDEKAEMMNEEVEDDEEEMAQQLSQKDCDMEEEEEEEREPEKSVDDDEPVATDLDPLSKTKETQPDVETGEPPMVRRVEQWQQKPKAKAKAKAGPKAKAKAKAKSKVQGKGKEAKSKKNSKRKAEETVEVLASGEEGEVPEEEVAKPSQRKRVARKARAKSAAKTEPSGSNEHSAKASDSKENKEPPIKYKPVTEEGKADIEEAFNWEEGNGKGQAGEECESVAGSDLGEHENQEPEPNTDKKKNDLQSFARRPPPKTSPSRDRWLVIRDVFNEHLVPALKLVGFPIYKWEAW